MTKLTAAHYYAHSRNEAVVASSGSPGTSSRTRVIRGGPLPSIPSKGPLAQRFARRRHTSLLCQGSHPSQLTASSTGAHLDLGQSDDNLPIVPVVRLRLRWIEEARGHMAQREARNLGSWRSARATLEAENPLAAILTNTQPPAFDAAVIP